MRVHQDLNELPPFRNAAVTIGSFDGVHRGHQKIIEKLRQLAREVDGESVLITFYPHPRQVVYPKDDSLRLLTTIDEKIALLERFGLDHVVIVPFTVEFSQLSADEYIEKFLVEKFRPKYIVIGHDHRFGLSRHGDINYLRWHGPRFGYTVIAIEPQEVEQITVSSTKIRVALERADLSAANRLLNYRYLLTGTVVRGQNIGSRLGFPTANLELNNKHKLIPPDGIYAVFAHHQQRRFNGMLYIGARPTLGRDNARSIEVNIFDFDENIYGDMLRLELVAHLRGDMAFDDMEALRKQMEFDREKAKILLQAQAREQAEKKISPSVAVVILNYNGKEYLRRFLPSVMASGYANCRVYVADNGSNDGSRAFLEAEYPEVRRLDLGANHGYARGYNLALRQIDADYYILLNSDVEVETGWIAPVVELMERDPLVAACQPKVRSYQDRERFEYAGAAGGWLDNLGYPFCRGRIFADTELDEGQYDRVQEIFWATGAAFFTRASLFHRIGGFDEVFFAHAEEIDLCWRLKRAGYKIMVCPQSVVYHVGGGTLDYQTPYKTYLNFRNTLFTMLKNEPLKRLLWLAPTRLALDGLAAGLFLFQGKFKHIASIARAHWSFFTRLPRTWKSRGRSASQARRAAVAPRPNSRGRYPGSVVWQYYARGRKCFQQLPGMKNYIDP